MELEKILKYSPVEIIVIIPETGRPKSAQTVSAKKNPTNPETKMALRQKMESFGMFLQINETKKPTITPSNVPPTVKLILSR